MKLESKMKNYNINYKKYINIFAIAIFIITILYLIYINFIKNFNLIRTTANIIDKECNYNKSLNNTNDMTYDCVYNITYIDNFNLEHEVSISVDQINLHTNQHTIQILYDPKNYNDIKVYNPINTPIFLFLVLLIVFILYNFFSK